MSRSARRGTLTDAREKRSARLRDTWNSAGMPDASILAAAAAAASAVVGSAVTARSFAANFGDGAASQYDIVHSRGTLDVHVTVVRIVDGVSIAPAAVTRLDGNTVRLNFGAPVALDAYRALILY